MNLVCEDNIESENFRFQGYQFHLAYMGLYGKPTEKALLNYIRNTFSRYDLEKYSLVSDETDEEGEHIHAFFKFKKKLDLKSLKRLSFSAVSPNFRTVIKDKHIDNIINYHETKREDPTTNIIKSESKVNVWIGGRKPESAFRERCFSEYNGSVSEMIKSEKLTDIDRKKLTKSMMSAVHKFPEPDIFPFDVPIFNSLREMMLDTLTENSKITWLYDLHEISDFMAFTKYVSRYLPYTLLLPIATELEVTKKIFDYKSEGIEFMNFVFFATRESRIQDEFYDIIKKLNGGLLVPPNFGTSIIDISSPNVYILSGQDLKYECKLHRWFDYRVTLDGKTFIDKNSDKYLQFILPK